jgi:hypothetical protein
MEKSSSKIFKDERKKKIYSDDDTKIIELMKKSK